MTLEQQIAPYEETVEKSAAMKQFGNIFYMPEEDKYIVMFDNFETSIYDTLSEARSAAKLHSIWK
jgi:hypothetical protein